MAVPKDQISMTIFHGMLTITSGLLYIIAPTGVPVLAHVESAE